jgi:hypothetical protein
MNKLPLVILFASTLVFGGLYFFNQPEMQTVEVKNPLNDEMKSANARLKTEIKILTGKVASLESQLGLVKNTTVKNGSTVTAAVANKEPDAAASNPLLKMLSNPQVAAAMNKRRTDMVKGRYSYLFKKLNLSEDDQKVLVDLLGEKFMASAASRMKQFGNRGDEDAKATADAEKEDAYAAVDAKIENLLGDEFNVYSDYNEKRREYDYVSGLNRGLGEDAQLSENQTDKLATVMNETKSEYQFNNEKFNTDDRYAVYKYSKEERQEYAKELEIRDELVLKDSSEFLDTDQQKALAERQQKDRERLTSNRRGFSGFGRRGRGEK